MLKKLLKYEFKALGRYFLPLYAFVIVLTPIFSFMMRVGFRDEAGMVTALSALLSTLGFISMLLAIFIASYALILVRFYRTTATSEAYLTFTLPATPGQILWSKLLTAVTYELTCFIVIFAAIFSMLFLSGALTLSDINDMFGELFRILREHTNIVAPTLILWLISMLVGAFTSILQFYCSVMLGQLFNSHRVLISIGFYVAIYIAEQFVSTIVSLSEFLTSEPDYYSSSVGFEISFLNGLTTGMNSSLIIALIINIVFGAAFFISTIMIMKKRLNVR